MKNFKYSVKFKNENIEKIWKIWSEVENWNKWDKSIKKSYLNWDFEKWITWYIIPTKWPKIKFILEEVIKNKKFTNVSKLPFCKIKFIHTINNWELSHCFEFSWLLSWLFSKILWKQISDDIINALNNIKKILWDLD